MLIESKKNCHGRTSGRSVCNNCFSLIGREETFTDYFVRPYLRALTLLALVFFKGTGHFFETFSVGSVQHGTDYS